VVSTLVQLALRSDSGVNLPQNQTRNTYQTQDNISYTNGNHAWKFGADIRRNQLHQLFKPTTRGLLEYASLDFLVKDLRRAQTSTRFAGHCAQCFTRLARFLFLRPGRVEIKSKLHVDSRTAYENAGQPSEIWLITISRCSRPANNDPRFVLTPVPGRDNNNFQPRLGFNWNPQTRK
jgi:hypothetical protein